MKGLAYLRDPMNFRNTRRFTPKWWLSLPLSAKGIYRRLSSPDQAINGMSSWWYGALERRPIETILANAARGDYAVHNAGWREPGTSITIMELNCILMAMREVNAKKVIEVGTFNGNTTLNIAANLPEDGQVVTLDLPVDEHMDYALNIQDGLRNVTDRQVVGQQFLDSPVSGRVKQVFGDSATLDWNTFGGPFDLAFIDGCHDYNYVKSDTDNALKVVRPGGAILWHDYAQMDGVSRAVDEYQGKVDRLCAIEGARIAIGFVRG